MMANPPDFAKALCEERGLPMTGRSEAPGNAEDARSLSAAAGLSGLVVLDGYGFGQAFLEELQRHGVFTCLLADDASTQGPCQAILNGNLFAEGLSYDPAQCGEALLGPRYAVVADAFREARQHRLKKPVADPVKRVLVTMGGADPTDETSKVLTALSLPRDPRLPRLSVRVVAGAAKSAAAYASRNTASGPHVIEIVGPLPTLATEMQEADVAITAGGTTCLELLCAGVPALVWAVAENQAPVARELSRRGLMENLGWRSDVTAARIATALTQLCLDVEKRRDVARRQREAVDGRGKDRAMERLLSLHSVWGAARAPVLRRAVPEDAEFVWRVNNDPTVRERSIHTAPIPWENHLDWFAGRLLDPRCLFLIAEVRGERIGLVRFELESGDQGRSREAVIAIALAAAARGRGLGTRLIALGTEEALRGSRANGASGVVAFVRPSNLASLQAFSGAGYVEAGTVERNGVTLRRLVFRPARPAGSSS